jgi:hypothetical protein
MITVKPGDTIRAYDFKPMLGREDSFVEGVVLEDTNTEQGYTAYKIRVTRDHFDRATDTALLSGVIALNQRQLDNRVNHEVFVPHKVSFMEYAGRVVNLSQ